MIRVYSNLYNFKTKHMSVVKSTNTSQKKQPELGMHVNMKKTTLECKLQRNSYMLSCLGRSTSCTNLMQLKEWQAATFSITPSPVYTEQKGCL